MTLRLSAVIPSWREEREIAGAIASARAWADEVIVSDAGSPDATVSIARDAGALVVESATKGRGPQLHAGASAATGDVLVFLHADARLPAEARGAIEEALAAPEVQGGNFLLRFAPRTPFGELCTAISFVRRFLGIYYGDSAIFVRRAIYDALGGFRPLPLFEDYEFARRLERRGATRYLWRVAVTASDRRFAERPMRTLALWLALQGMYDVGVSPDLLARLYAEIRRP